MEVRQTVNSGRGLFATRSYEIGDLVWSEDPLGWTDNDDAIASTTTLPDHLQGDDDYERERYNAMTVEGYEVELSCFDFLPHGQQDQVVTAVYERASYINHSCVHNCSRAFDGLRLYVRANRAIAVGEELTIGYCSRYLSLLQRRAVFADFGFVCRCERCMREEVTTSSSDEAKVRQYMSTRQEPELYVALCPLPALSQLITQSSGAHRLQWIERLLQVADCPDDLTIGCCLLLVRDSPRRDTRWLNRLHLAWRVRAAGDTSYDAFQRRYGACDDLRDHIRRATS